MINLHCGDAVVDGVAFDGVEAGTLDHFDDLLFGHFSIREGLSPLRATYRASELVCTA